MIDLNGQRVTTLQLFGQQKHGECSPGRITGAKICHAAGVVVDRRPGAGHIYVADTGNNRILGFRAYGSASADLIFGQPGENTGAPNGDCNTGTYARPTRNSACLMNIPSNPNFGEQWMRVNMDAGSDGTLYVPDFHNDRVLVFQSPFEKGGDLQPDLVLGQDDFTRNGPNRGKGPGVRDASSLYISFGGFDHVASRGVSVDDDGNVWVADTFNFRVLRFPRGRTTADLVLGQPNFEDSIPNEHFAPEDAPLDRMCTPTLARMHPDTGELYVIDEYPGGFRARILVFTPPFKAGMAAARMIFPQQRLEGDFANGYTFRQATGLVFNPFLTVAWVDEAKTARYRDGVLWVHNEHRTLLLDGKGNILLAIGAPDVITLGGRSAGRDPETPFNLVWPGGSMGFDADNNIYLADERWHRIARFALPYRVEQTPNGPVLPPSNGGLFPGTLPNNVGPAHFSGPNVGAITFGNQLIVRDHKRYLAWNNYRDVLEDGPPADVVVGQSDGSDVSQDNMIYGRGNHTIDHMDRLWTAGAHGKLLVYALPLTSGAQPLRQMTPLYWADDGTEIPYRCEQPVAFDPIHQVLWVYDTTFHRLLRVQNPGDGKSKLLVDTVIGQGNKTDSAINRGMPAPDASSFGDVNDIRFDRFGNLFVVDNTYECHPNGRVIVFLAEDLASLGKELFPPIEAKLVFVVDNFTETSICHIHQSVDRPFSPVFVAFNSRNEMVLGNDGYYLDPRTRHITQLYLYRDPLKKQTPDAVIELPVGTPGELSFDEKDNLIVQDHTWSKLWVINFDTDPGWLREL